MENDKPAKQVTHNIDSSTPDSNSSRKSLLDAIDPIHRSLLFNNLLFEDLTENTTINRLDQQRNRNQKTDTQNQLTYSQEPDIPTAIPLNDNSNTNSIEYNLVSSQQCSNDTLSSDHRCYQSTSVTGSCRDDTNFEMEQNKQNLRCEKSNKKCANGFCYCFSSDSGDNVLVKRNRRHRTGSIRNKVRNKPEKTENHEKREQVITIRITTSSPKKSADKVPSKSNHQVELDDRNESCSWEKIDEESSSSYITSNNSVVMNQSSELNSSIEPTIFYDCDENDDTVFKSIESCAKKPPPKSKSIYSENVNIDSSSQSSVKGNPISDEPMLCITQELNVDRTVTNTIKINKEKVKRWRQSGDNKKKKKKRLKIIDDNFCNEILDETLNWGTVFESKFNDNGSVLDSNQLVDTESLSIDGEMICEQLNARPKFSGKTIGKLMKNRLESVKRNHKSKGSKKKQRTAPTKPPRTFISTQSSNTSSMDAQISGTTVPIDDLCSPPHSEKSRKHSVGWLIDRNIKNQQSMRRDKLKNSPKIGWVNEVKSNKIGWDLPVIPDIIGMLNDQSRNVISSNLKAQPQHTIPSAPKIEDIDTVDGTVLRNDSNGFENFRANLTNKSTPMKSISKFHQKPLPDVPKHDEHADRCDNCHKKIRPKRKSFRKKAMKRTRSFLESSAKRILNKSKSEPSAKRDFTESDVYVTPIKSDLTNIQNSDSHYETCKQSLKNLNITLSDETPKQSNICNPESKSPLRKSLIFRNKSTEPIGGTPSPATKSFDFKRIIDSPKRAFIKRTASLKLTPKKLFKSLKPADKIESVNRAESYKSFADDNDDITALMGKYLRDINNCIEHDVGDDYLEPSRYRKSSTSTDDMLDHVSEQIVEIDLHPEPIYSEILPRARLDATDSIDVRNNNKMRQTDDPIYATVNKSLNKSNSLTNFFKTINKKQSTDTILNNSIVSVPSCESLQLNVINDFAQSIQNILDNRPKDTNENHLPIETVTVGQDSKSIEEMIKNVDEKFVGRGIDVKHLLEIDDISSCDTSCMTDSLYQHVLNVVSVNDEIAKAIGRVERLDPTLLKYDSFRRALPDSDSESFGQLFNVSTSTLNRTAPVGDYIDLNTSDLCSQLQKKSSTFSSSRLSDSNRGLSQLRNLFHKNDSSLAYNNSEPTTSQMQFDASFNASNILNDSNMSILNASTSTKSESSKYKNLKEKLSNSLKRSKLYMQHERKRLGNLFDEGIRRNDRSIEKIDEKTENPEEENKKRSEILYETIKSRLNESNVSTENDQYILKLINQITYQREIRQQLRNAVQVCRITPEFKCSMELVEAERLLLLCHMKETVAKRELIKIDYENDGKYVKHEMGNGSFAIQTVEFNIKSDTLFDNHFNNFYVCVCTNRAQVKSTYAVESKLNRILFDKCKISFTELEPNFEIRIEIYVLRLRKNGKNASQDNLLCTNKDPKSRLIACPTPTKLMSPKQLFLPSSGKSNDKNSDVTRFKSHGYSIVRGFRLTKLTNLNSDSLIDEKLTKCDDGSYISYKKMNKSFNLMVAESQQSPNIDGRISITFQTEVKFENNSVSGFVNIAEYSDGLNNWNRRWCKVNGFSLDCWNYPQENSELDPIQSLDLTKCVLQTIEPVDRNICPRPRTFAITSTYPDTVDSKKGCTKTYFISADNPSELSMWLKELNRILSFIRDWDL